MRWGSCEFSGIDQLRERLSKAADTEFDAFLISCAKDLAAKLLSLVIPRTPVGDYHGDQVRYKRSNTKTGAKKGELRFSKNDKAIYGKKKSVNFSTKNGKTVSFQANVAGKVGGTLRRGWTAGGKSATPFDSIQVKKEGGGYVVEVINHVAYASYVEYGHRTKGDGFVIGRYMLSRSELILLAKKDAILKKKLEKWLQEVMQGGK